MKDNLIGRRLFELRRKNNLTLKELSDKINISKGHLSELENGKSTPSIQTLIDICSFYDMNLITFFTDTDEPIKLNKEQLELINLTKNMSKEEIHDLSNFIRSFLVR